MTLHSMLLLVLIFFGIVAAPFSILQPILLIRNRNLRKYSRDSRSFRRDGVK